MDIITSENINKMKTSKKKIIIGSIVAFVILVSALAIGITINIKNEKEAQEVARIEQEEKDKALKQQEQEEKERQEKLAKYETEWNLLEDGKQYLALGSDYLKRVEKHENGLYSYKISEEFVGTLYSIVDGFYNGATMEDLGVILNGALASLPDNATGKDVYDALVDYADTVDRDEVVTGEGTNPMDVLTPSTNQSSTNNNSSNNNSSNNNNSTNNSNSTNSNNSSNPPTDSSTESTPEDDREWADSIFAGNEPGAEWSEDDQAGVGGGLGTGGN